MTRMDHDSPSEIRGRISELGISLKKRWGQNFLINSGARSKILSALDVAEGESVWEIGPGLGAMTGALIELGSRVTAFEIDRGLCRHLESVYATTGRFTLVQGDFLKTWKTVRSAGEPDRVVGNLPYSSASLMIASLAESGMGAMLMVFTVQKELGERMLAVPGTKAYSAFSVLCQTCFSAESRGVLKPGSFYPAPEVESMIIVLAPRVEKGHAADRSVLSALTRMLFSSRRKTMRNNVSPRGIPPLIPGVRILDAMNALGIDPGRRAEELGPQDFIALSDELSRIK